MIHISRAKVYGLALWSLKIALYHPYITFCTKNHIKELRDSKASTECDFELGENQFGVGKNPRWSNNRDVQSYVHNTYRFYVTFP